MDEFDSATGSAKNPKPKAANAMNESEIFDAATRMPVDSERVAWLDGICKGDAALRRRIGDLLHTHYQGDMFLERPSPESMGTTLDFHRGEVAGTLIAGRYKLVEAIGEGGMGSVWLAEQQEPIRRKVAVKLIKAGLDSKSVLARFNVERQALAIMDHPGIAKVFDGGVNEQGRPYFVMEYVQGMPLTDYCNRARLSLRERLQLFLPVCQAVQHAHQKGIIHRDLKPSNILVCLNDGKPVPKVIDFGLAKAMHQSLTGHSVNTAHGVMVGTPLYMSPEQAEHNNLDVDTRTDIFSLGVVLYELLTGSTPLGKQQLKEAAFNEILRLIREVEPPKPSTRLNDSASLPSIAAQRSVEPKQLSKSLVGDLDWIVMKALDKERSRRYETAIGFARDVQRFLNDEAVEACPPSATYRFRKFVRRNKIPVLAAGVLLVSLLIAIAGTTFGLYRATISGNAERLAKIEAQDQMRIARTAEVAEARANQQAQARLSQIEKSNALLVSVFDDLNIHEVREGTEPLEAVLADRLKMAARELEEDSIGDPLVVSNLQNQLGITLLSLGFPDDAIPLFLKVRETRTVCLGVKHTDTLDCMNNLATGYLDSGNFDAAATLFEETLNRRLEIQDVQNPDVLNGKENLAAAWIRSGNFDLAIPLLEETLTLRKRLFGKDYPDTLNCMIILAEAYREAGKYKEAVTLNTDALNLKKEETGAAHVVTLTIMNNLAYSILESGNPELALPIFEETLQIQKKKLGNFHPKTLISMNNLALCYQAVGEIGLALPMFEETLKLKKARLGEKHPHTISGMNNLARAYLNVGLLDLALPLYEATHGLMKTTVGVNHPDTLQCMSNLANAYFVAGKPELALPLYEETLALRRLKLGPDHVDTIKSMEDLAGLCEDEKNWDLAIALFDEVFTRKKTKLGVDDSSTLSSMNKLVFVYWQAKHFEKSVPLCEESLKLHEAKLGRNHPDTLLVAADLGVNYKDAGRLSDALPLLEEAWQASVEHPSLTKVGSQLLTCYLRLGRTADTASIAAQLVTRSVVQPKIFTRQQAGILEFRANIFLQKQAFSMAEPLLRDVWAIRKKLQPDYWITYDCQSQLGEALLGMKKYSEAESLLLDGYEGLRKRENEIPALAKSRIPDAMDRLVKLYSSWHVAEPDKGNGKKAAEWKTKKNQFELGKPVK